MFSQYKKYTNNKRSHDHLRSSYKVYIVRSKKAAMHNRNENDNELW